MATKESTNTKIAKASLAFTRQSARKVRRTANLLRKLTAGEAVTQLEFMPYEAAQCLKKLIGSAMANANHNLEIENPADLKISQLLVDEGVTYKRWRAMSKGRAYSIMKRTSKASVVLSEMDAAEYAKYVWDHSPRNKKRIIEETVTETKKSQAEPKAQKVEEKTETASQEEPKAKKSKAKPKAKKEDKEPKAAKTSTKKKKTSKKEETNNQEADS